MAEKTKLDSVRSELQSKGWDSDLLASYYWRESILGTGLAAKNLPLAFVATELLKLDHPTTLRGLFYRVVSSGWLPSTDKKQYNRLGRIMKTLREKEVVPFSWIVDNMRSTIRPSSWSGIGDFIETVKDAYRKDFWESLPEYVHVFCEKDAIAGVLAQVTQEFDVALSPLRGYVSLTYAHEIADLWNGIRKPIFAYYLGDFDPSGFDLERDLKKKLHQFGDHSFEWKRLAVNQDDFNAFNLIPLAPKRTDRRYKEFVDRHGHKCAELDALPATELRRQLRDAILQHVPPEMWNRLQETERLEKESFEKVLARIPRGLC